MFFPAFFRSYDNLWGMTPIPDGYTDLAPGRLAAVVTYLEMCRPPAADAAAGAVKPPAGVEIRLVEQPEADWYRRLFRAVGEEWLWFSRMTWNDDELLSTIRHPQVDIYALSCEGSDEGLLELDRRRMPEIEIALFGITARVIGRGVGRYFMSQALEFAWRHSPERVMLHTCTLDHPNALAFYLRSGFTAYKRAIEVAPDPRLTGALSRTAAPQVPVIG